MVDAERYPTMSTHDSLAAAAAVAAVEAASVGSEAMAVHSPLAANHLSSTATQPDDADSAGVKLESSLSSHDLPERPTTAPSGASTAPSSASLPHQLATPTRGAGGRSASAAPGSAAARRASSGGDPALTTPRRNYSPRPGSGPFATPVFPAPLAKATTAVDNVYMATYSTVEVLEFEVNGMSVMRRARDSALNATQILKLAGVDKSRRTKILEREITGDFEKVQGGYGKYQGTWVPFVRGVELCRQYSVYDILEPLLSYDMSQDHLQQTPTKEQAQAAKRKHSMAMRSESAGNASAYYLPPPPPQFQQTPLANHAMAALSSLDGNGSGAPGNSAGQEDARKKPRNAQEPSICLEAEPEPPLEPTDANFERSRDIVTELFLNANEDQRLSELLEAHEEPVLVDVPIDDSGHTALHWATALGRITLVHDLIKHGANPCRANYNGETPLLRAVLVTNSSDKSTFAALLDEIYPALYLADSSGRTVLHHIALTAGIKGRSDASRYYLETLLEWVVRRGSASKDGNFGLSQVISYLVNRQDYYGDTALNIAARIGNKTIARQLIDVGADVQLANRARLRPIDFGVVESLLETAGPVPETTQVTADGKVVAGADAKSLAATVQPATLSGEEKRKELLSLMHESLDGLEQDFEREVASKQQLIDSVHAELRQANQTLSQARADANRLRSIDVTLCAWEDAAKTLQTVIQDEEQDFATKEKQKNREPTPIAAGRKYDADRPFRVTLEGRTETGDLLPPVLLKARIAAYKQNESRLQKLKSDLISRSSHLEGKFRKVVAMCTGVPEDQVDSLLENLVQAVESDNSDLDMSRISGFLKKIGPN